MGRGSLTDEMIAAIVCREMGWTKSEFDEQPATFVDTIVEMLRAEGKAMERRAKENQ